MTVRWQKALTVSDQGFIGCEGWISTYVLLVMSPTISQTALVMEQLLIVWRIQTLVEPLKRPSLRQEV